MAALTQTVMNAASLTTLADDVVVGCVDADRDERGVVSGGDVNAEP